MTIDFIPWAIGNSADVISQADFAALFGPGGIGTVGFQSGLANSLQLNKVWRQSSFVAAALATAVGQTLSQDVLDNGNLSELVGQIEAFVTALVSNSTAAFQTGDTKWRPTGEQVAGWVRMNALSIGSASSGASERANADCLALYSYLWNNFTQSQCPVTGGRGASAAADFNANKPIKLLDLRGRFQAGLDGMGNALAGVITQGTPNVPGSIGGAEFHTIAQGNLPAVQIAITASGTTSTAGAHAHDYNQAHPGSFPDDFNRQNLASGSSIIGFDVAQTDIQGAHFHGVTVSGFTAALGGGSALLTISPYMLGTFYEKL